MNSQLTEDFISWFRGVPARIQRLSFHWSNAMIPHVIEARHTEGHRVWLKFDDGACGGVDLSDELDGLVFQPLKDMKFFRQFLIRYNTRSWENEADFAPEFLREKLFQQFPNPRESDLLNHEK